ncbi:MAG: sigma-54 dependent transcriptional regulator [Paramuribaculum sp.]|nr:sigma-54 dependent transcriptional regulator [Paramuribaculum sp.]
MEINLSDIPEEVQQAKLRFGIVGNSPALVAAVSRAIRVAPIDLSVLITGESGSGKEFFPKIIHAYGSRKHNKYIAVNCGAIPEGTIDSELFGHEKGAFTGAVATRKGYFEEADGGTIFLDEVAELPLTTQARLLRVLETGEFIKVGSSTVQKTNIRVVAATNVDLIKAVEQGRFREDLYYRLSTVHISIPPLRDRGNDITLLARKFAADFAERYRTPQISFDEEAKQMLLHYRWPGNVRQLKNVTDQIALFNAGQTVGSAEIIQYLPPSSGVYTPAVAPSHNAHDYERERELLFNMLFRLQNEIDSLRKEIKGEHPVAEAMPKSLVKYSPAVDTIILGSERNDIETAPATLEETEKETIRRSLENNGGRRKATAKELNISERTLYRKIKEYGLE